MEILPPLPRRSDFAQIWQDVELGFAPVPRWMRYLFVGLVIATGCYIFFPLLRLPFIGCAYLESYTASLRTIAIELARGHVGGQDALMPLLTEYLYYTRAGVIFLLVITDYLFGAGRDLGFSLLMIGSVVVIGISSITFARKWGGVRPLSSVIALLMTPGFVQTSFFYNDNLISVAFGAAALAVVSRWRSVGAFFLAGLLIEFGILCRTDCVLLAPILLGPALLETPAHSVRIKRIFALATGGLSLAGVIALTLHVELFDFLRFMQGFMPHYANLRMREFLLAVFFGPTISMLAIVGLCLNVYLQKGKFDRFLWVIFFVLCPTVIIAIGVLAVSAQIRYLYPLLIPIVALHAGRALDWLGAAICRRTARLNVFAEMIALVLFIPWIVFPSALFLDGPTSYPWGMGGFWMVHPWLQWQDSRAISFGRLKPLIDSANTNNRLLVISSGYNDDFFLKLLLLRDGYDVVPVEKIFPDCHRGLSLYTKKARMVFHLRSDNQYDMAKFQTLYKKQILYIEALQISQGLDCPAVWSADKIALTGMPNSSLRPIYPELYGSIAELFKGDLIGLLSAPDSPDFRMINLAQLKELQANAKSIVEKGYQDKELFLNGKPFTYDDFLDIYKSRMGSRALPSEPDQNFK